MSNVTYEYLHTWTKIGKKKIIFQSLFKIVLTYSVIHKAKIQTIKQSAWTYV